MFELLKRFIKDEVVLYLILVLFLIILTLGLGLGLPLLFTLTCVIFWIISILIVNWIVCDCIKTSETEEGNTDEATNNR